MCFPSMDNVHLNIKEKGVVRKEDIFKEDDSGVYICLNIHNIAEHAKLAGNAYVTTSVCCILLAEGLLGHQVEVWEGWIRSRHCLKID